MIQIITETTDVQNFINEAVSKAFKSFPLPEGRKVEIIDGKELMTRLNISEPTLIRWRKRGKVPYLELGGSIRYDWFRVLDYLEKKGGKNV